MCCPTENHGCWVSRSGCRCGWGGSVPRGWRGRGRCPEDLGSSVAGAMPLGHPCCRPPAGLSPAPRPAARGRGVLAKPDGSGRPHRALARMRWALLHDFEEVSASSVRGFFGGCRRAPRGLAFSGRILVRGSVRSARRSPPVPKTSMRTVRTASPLALGEGRIRWVLGAGISCVQSANAGWKSSYLAGKLPVHLLGGDLTSPRAGSSP